MKNSILLVGGTGYLGRHLERWLSEIADVFLTGVGPRTAGNYFAVDYTRPETFRAVNKSFDIVIFLASRLEGIGKRNLDHTDIDVNVCGFGRFLQYIIDARLSSRFIYLSSMTVYGTNNVVPVEEDGATEPISVYGLSKLMAEQELGFATRMNDLKGVIARIPGLFGGDRTTGFVYNTYKLCAEHRAVNLTTGNLGYWEGMEVNDLSKMIRDFILSYQWNNSIEIYNFSYGQETDFLETAEKIKIFSGSKSRISVLDGRQYTRFFLSNRKLSRVVSIRASFDQSLKRYIEQLTQQA